jgi:phosphoglycolate phosphatase
LSPRLLLFDIDGTLLLSNGQAGRLFRECLREVYEVEAPVEGYDFGGKTDPQIVFELMARAGLPRAAVAERLAAMRELYLGRLEARLDRGQMRLLPGVTELLARLGLRADLTVGLLTGNWEPGARTKLGRFELNRFFAFGGFGEDGPERADLVPAALARARDWSGRAFAASETLIIGDTVHDVACAKAHGVPVLAVATGFTSVARLVAAGADWVAPDFHEAAQLLPVLAG